MFNLLTGILHLDAGRIHFQERKINGLAPRHIARAGIARTFQIPRPFGELTAYENVLVGATYGGRDASEQRVHQACVEALHRAALLEKANALAGRLTLLERKRLELARALVTRPRVLLLDEVAGGLTEPEVNELVATVRELRAEGVAIVWIEHIVHALLSVVDRLVALAAGRKLIEGDPQTVIASPQLRDVYLGSEL
jgi:branched-chain amino acid transport system ATP-binding protein